MKINTKDNLLLIDFWIVVCILILNTMFFLIHINIVFDYNVILFLIYFNIIFCFYNFIKSIIGGILIINSYFRKEIYLLKNKSKFNNYLLYISVYALIFCSVLIMFISSFKTNKNIITIIREILLLIYAFVNMLGIPCWIFWYTYSNNSISKRKKKILSIFTQIISISMYFIILYYLFVLILEY